MSLFDVSPGSWCIFVNVSRDFLVWLVSLDAVASVHNLPQQLAYAEAFAKADLFFLVSALAKKHAKAIKFLQILKKYIFVEKRKMFCLIKRLFLSFT